MHSAPPPDLRIIPTDSVFPHEEHDSQRSTPLIERLKVAEYVTNPPIVAPMDQDKYVILDGANRCYSFGQLGFEHILVQVASYESGYVDLQTWNHVISDWDAKSYLAMLEQYPEVKVNDGQSPEAIAHLLLPDGQSISLCAPVQSTHERNAVLRAIVRMYQQNAILYRTALNEPEEVWSLYPEAVGLMVFPDYQPSDIIAAAKYKAFLPPGISRHIIYGRALMVNYPMQALQDTSVGLADKNEALQGWIHQKLANRQVRYYAEATYQFSE